jgi:tRNA/rRNA methyltransferase
MSEAEALSRIRVVLSHPTHPGNIGAAARAIKTMGLSQLFVVRPKRFPDPEAIAMSSNAVDVLERAVICDSLDDALKDVSLAVAVSARSRVLSHPPLDARSAAVEAVVQGQNDQVAFVFGNETAGLTNEEVMKCSRLAYIPTHPEHRSLNLAAAVQVIAYECRMAALGDVARTAPQLERASHEEVENFFGHLELNLYQSGFLDPANPRRLMERLRRVFLRANLEKEEVNILRGILSAWDSPRVRKRNPPSK